MQIITPGHKYELPNMEGSAGQIIQFIEKEQVTSDGDMATVNDGTTNEAVLEVLIDRLRFLQEKMPCRENAIAITKLEESLMWLNKRTAERIARDVEGKHIA